MSTQCYQYPPRTIPTNLNQITHDDSNPIGPPPLNGMDMTFEPTNEFDHVTADTYDPDSNVYISNLPSYVLYNEYYKQQLYTLFGCYGPIERYKFVAPYKAFQRGYGFVQYANRKDACSAIENLEGYTFATGEKIGLSIALRRSTANEQSNLYIKHFPSSWTNAELRKLFGVYGRIRQSKVVIGDGIAFVRYETRAQAVKAINHLHGRMMDDGRKLKVRFATRKTAVTDTKPSIHGLPISNRNRNNLYVFNLPNYYNYASLERLFARYGMTSCAKFNTNGTAFVRFIHAEDAMRAIQELNGKKLPPFDQPIGVELARYDIGDSRNSASITKLYGGHAAIGCTNGDGTTSPISTVSSQDANDTQPPMNNQLEIQLALQAIQQQLNQLDFT